MWTAVMLAVLASAAQEPTAPPALPPGLPALAPVIVPTPGAEAEALALELARTGTLASLLPLIAAKETEELVAAHPELSAAEQARLRGVAQATFAAGRDRLFAATAREYARRLTLADLRQLAAIARLPASQRLRQVQPAAIIGTMTAMAGAGAGGAGGAGLDFKRDTLAAFCRETGKGCVVGK